MSTFKEFFWSAFGEGCMPTKNMCHEAAHASNGYIESPTKLGDFSYMVAEDSPIVVDIADAWPCKEDHPLPKYPVDLVGEEDSCIEQVCAPRRINLSGSQNCRKNMNIDFAALRDPDCERRRKAVAGVGSCFLGRHPGEFNQEAANLIMPALRAAMRDERWEVRAQAATSLSNLGPEAVYHAVPVLWETCSDPELAVRQAALLALQAHGQDTPPECKQRPRIVSRSWQEPPSLQSVLEESSEDGKSECPQEDLSTTATSDNSSRLSSKHLPTASDNSSPQREFAAGATLPSEFTMSVGRPLGCSLGIAVNEVKEQKNCLEVVAVNDGIIKDWNTKQADCKLELGDRIREVNGRGGSPQELLALLKRNTWLEVLVQRPPSRSGALTLAVL